MRAVRTLDIHTNASRAERAIRPRECCGNLQPEHRVNLRHRERQYSPKGFHGMAMAPNASPQYTNAHECTPAVAPQKTSLRYLESRREKIDDPSQGSACRLHISSSSGKKKETAYTQLYRTVTFVCCEWQILRPIEQDVRPREDMVALLRGLRIHLPHSMVGRPGRRERGVPKQSNC